MPRRSKPTAGEPFNPWRKECGFYPPEIVGANTDLKLTDGQKRLYERAVRWAGKKGNFWYAFVTIAQALGKSVRQTKHDMSILEQKGLIRHTRRQRTSNLYEFIWHVIFEVQSTAHQNSDFDVQAAAPQVATLEVQDNVPLEVQCTAQESCPLNYVQEESSSSEGSKTEIDDDEIPIPERDKNENRSADTEAYPLAQATEQLREARAAGAGIPVNEQLPPDREITLKILGYFQKFEDFTVWLKTTITRNLARKANGPRWGLYATDAANHSQGIAVKRERMEKDEIDAAIMWQHRQSIEADMERTMDTPMPAQQALRLVQSRVDRVPQLLKARLERTGELITPNELERQVRAWKSCPHCQDGKRGSAIDRDLRFCACAAGIEAIHRDGADYPEQQIMLVHADAKSLLVAACHAVRSPFSADAIEESDVTDDGESLEIHLQGTGARHGLSESNVQAALDRVGLIRRIVIRGGPQILNPPKPASNSRPASPICRSHPGGLKSITQADIDAIMGRRKVN
jgi:hypothetical protein